ncbi:uncharacterized protein LOC130206435 [Pseudoliparis swirei]|uniref:uncharacterized protein LOC130206435 n=1 Tax=Pseudoliparis swirei TaxID=2059687 RepID=UPI0024BE55B2|nr:uncharacterized protein LOC130206435 [Pseudoliparis swirei]
MRLSLLRSSRLSCAVMRALKVCAQLRPATMSRGPVCIREELPQHRGRGHRVFPLCQRGHKIRDCQRGQQWYRARAPPGEEDGGSKTTRVECPRRRMTFVFKLVTSEPGSVVTGTGLLVDTGATSHIITDLTKFKSFDDRFQSEKHDVELADGTSCTGVAERRGNAEVCLVDSRGRSLRATLKQALDIPLYPQDIFSVRAATSSGATVIFTEGRDVVQSRDVMQIGQVMQLTDAVQLVLVLV